MQFVPKQFLISKNNTLLNTLVILLVEKLILEQIKCEFLRNWKITPKSTIYKRVKQIWFKKLINYHIIWVNFLKKFQINYFINFNFVYTVLSGECIQKPSQHYVHLYKTCKQKFLLPFRTFFVPKVRHPNCTLNSMLKCVLTWLNFLNILNILKIF